MKRPICYQQLFVSIKVCRLVSCDFMTMLGRRHAKSFIRKRADSCLNSWICEYLENMDFQRHCYIVHWHCSQCDGLEYHSNSKRSPLRLLRPARACGIEFHRLHIWFIWKIMDFCSYAGLSELLDWTLLCYGQHHWGVWLIHDTFWKGYPCLAQAYRLMVGILCLTTVKMCK